MRVGGTVPRDVLPLTPTTIGTIAPAPSTPVPDTPDTQPVPEAPDTQPVPEAPDIQPVPEAPDTQPVPDTPDIQPIPDAPDIQPVPDTPPGTSTTALAVKFKPASAPEISGYVADTGEVYGHRGNGYIYGWSVSHTSRGFYHEFVAGFGWGFAFWSRIDMLTGSAKWEIAVPNGAYDVQLLAGGCNNGGFTQRVALEGVLVMNATPLDDCGGYGEEVVESKSVVTVRDGRLTMTNGSGALGNRIISISFVPRR